MTPELTLALFSVLLWAISEAAKATIWVATALLMLRAVFGRDAF